MALDLTPAGKTHGQTLDEILGRFAGNATPGEDFIAYYSLNADRTVRCYKMGTPPAPTKGSKDEEITRFRECVRAERKRANDYHEKYAQEVAINLFGGQRVADAEAELAALRGEKERLEDAFIELLDTCEVCMHMPSEIEDAARAARKFFAARKAAK